MPTEPRLVGLFAHPDDEIFAAGLLRRSVLAGASIRIVTATAGEAGTRRDGGDEATLARDRIVELTAACAALGVEPPELLGLPDGALAGDEAAAHVRDVLARLEPEVVVTFGPDGAYGHRDHIELCRIAVAALRDRPDVRLLHMVFPPGLFAPVWRALQRLSPSPIDPDIRAEDLGSAPRPDDLRLPLGEHRAAKLAAIAAHRSQLARADPSTFLARDLVPRLLTEEVYRAAAGPALPPGVDDPFAGLR